MTNGDQCMRIGWIEFPDNVFTDDNTVDVLIFFLRYSDPFCSIDLARKCSIALSLIATDADGQEFVHLRYMFFNRFETPMIAWQLFPYIGRFRFA